MESLNEVSFEKPQLKNKCYISHLNKPFKLKINDVKLKNIKKLKGSSNYNLSLYISPNTNKDIIENIIYTDDLALESILNNNNTWFNNELEENELKELYNVSYCNQTNSLNCILSNNIPYNITINNKTYLEDNILLEILKDFRELKKYIISVELLHAGLYFYPKLSTNKWIIKSINLTNIEYEECYWTKEEIEQGWENNVAELSEKIQELIKEKEKAINSLNELKEDLKSKLLDVKENNNTDNLWENKISILKKIIKESFNRILSTNDNR